uniref:C-type lectin domain-containing protein n=1 Tax=Kryptolebias marmoratus TaxID=37003 RepID=A0A3Q3A4D2_KRYMA
MCVTASGRNTSKSTTSKQKFFTSVSAFILLRFLHIKNPEENDRVKAKIPDDKSAWLGLFRDRWKWSNGAKITYTYWKTGQPYGPTENCVVANFGNSGYWEDWNCDSTKAFICHQGKL